MKSKRLLFSSSRTTALGLMLGVALFAWTSAKGQNLVRNADFEDPLGPDNWTIVYAAVLNGGSSAPTMSGPSDFFTKGRVRMAHKDLVPGTWDGDPYFWSKEGLDFKAGHDWMMHAYASQVITNLTPFSAYVVTAWMAQYEGPVDKVQVWMEVLGGANGLISKNTPYVTDIVLNNPTGWAPYSVTNSASASGRIEIRLHYNKNVSTANEKWRSMDALYDHVSLIPAGQAPYQPPFSITSITRAGTDLTLSWQSLMNNSYRLQVSANISDPGAWSLVQWDPSLDPTFFGTGQTITFKTNVVSLLSYNPAIPTSGPLYFRVRGTGFQP